MKIKAIGIEVGHVIRLTALILAGDIQSGISKVTINARGYVCEKLMEAD